MTALAVGVGFLSEEEEEAEANDVAHRGGGSARVLCDIFSRWQYLQKGRLLFVRMCG